MMQRTMLMHYHLPGGSTFCEQETIERFLSNIASQGYSLATFTYPGNLAGLTRSPLSGTPERAADAIPALPPTLQKDLELFVAGKNPSLWVLAFPKGQRPSLNCFKSGIAFQASSATISLVMTLENIAFAASESENFYVFEQWLALFQKAYTHWQPVYAHSLVPALKWPEPSRADLESGRVSYLYEINFWGPELVERMGRERVMSAPAWRVQSLANGGVLLVPECIFSRRDPYIWRSALQHLGMKQALWCQYVPTLSPV